MSLTIVNNASRTIAKAVLKAGSVSALDAADTIVPNNEKTYSEITLGTYTLTIYENTTAPILSVRDCALDAGVTKTITLE